MFPHFLLLAARAHYAAKAHNLNLSKTSRNGALTLVSRIDDMLAKLDAGCVIDASAAWSGTDPEPLRSAA